jgi:hypothetical protein
MQREIRLSSSSNELVSRPAVLITPSDKLIIRGKLQHVRCECLCYIHFHFLSKKQDVAHLHPHIHLLRDGCSCSTLCFSPTPNV